MLVFTFDLNQVIIKHQQQKVIKNQKSLKKKTAWFHFKQVLLNKFISINLGGWNKKFVKYQAVCVCVSFTINNKSLCV